MNFLYLVTAFYSGGICASIGYLLGGITNDPDIKSATWMDYTMGAFGCVFWPWFVAQTIISKDDR